MRRKIFFVLFIFPLKSYALFVNAVTYSNPDFSGGTNTWGSAGCYEGGGTCYYGTPDCPPAYEYTWGVPSNCTTVDYWCGSMPSDWYGVTFKDQCNGKWQGHPRMGECWFKLSACMNTSDGPIEIKYVHVTAYALDCRQTESIYRSEVDCQNCTESPFQLLNQQNISCMQEIKSSYGISDASCYDSNSDGYVDNLIVNGSDINAVPNCLTCEQRNAQTTFGVTQSIIPDANGTASFSGNIVSSEPVNSWDLSITGNNLNSIINSGSTNEVSATWKGTDASGNTVLSGEYKATLSAQTGNCSISKEQNIIVERAPSGSSLEVCQ